MPAPSVAAGMVRVATAKGAFFIDRYEAAVDDKGLALSAPGVIPANASWYEAKEACEKAGKRMCTSFEWVSACAGKDAVDNDSNGNFADDYVEGNQFPYADYNEPGYCHVDGDRREGRPQETGKSPRCVTPSGIYDLAGNVEEWIENDEGTAQLAGGDFRVGDKGSCVRAHRSFGAGHRSHGIGFRCCADRDVANSGSPAVLSVVPDSIVGEKAPKFSLKGADGGAVSEAILKGKVTFLTFFASWCGPCQRELPELAAMQVELAAKGVQIIAVGVDTDEADSRTFVAGLGPLPLTFVYDPNSRALGRFDVANMPTGYLIDRGGVIRHKQIGFGEKTRAELEAAIADLLK
jgi:peroxiredoxin